MISDQHPIDLHIGRRVKSLRVSLGISQLYLAERCKVSYQQVQKYETGRNRISPSRISLIAKALGVTPSYFFEHGGTEALSDGDADRAARASLDDQCAQIVSCLRLIRDDDVRRGLLVLIRSLAAADDHAPRDKASKPNGHFGES